MKTLIFTLGCLFITAFTFAQSSVSGTITDSNGGPLPGVNIIEKGTSNGTSTDFDGNYTLTVPNDAVLVISFVGFETQEIHNKFSLRASVTASLFFDNVRIPESNVLPNIIGMKGPLSCLSQARYGISWGVIGAAQACLNEALNYTNERVLFNRPVSHTQTIQIRLAEMARKITTAQLLSFKLGKLKDAGKITPSQISIAKWNNCRIALDIARDARDILGGSGISAEYVPIRHMLNLESVITYEGTETVHQLVVGKELTGVNAF